MSIPTVIVTEHSVTQISERRFRVTMEMEFDNDIVIPPNTYISAPFQVALCNVVRDALVDMTSGA